MTYNGFTVDELYRLVTDYLHPVTAKQHNSVFVLLGAIAMNHMLDEYDPLDTRATETKRDILGAVETADPHINRLTHNLFEIIMNGRTVQCLPGTLDLTTEQIELFALIDVVFYVTPEGWLCLLPTTVRGIYFTSSPTKANRRDVDYWNDINDMFDKVKITAKHSIAETLVKLRKILDLQEVRTLKNRYYQLKEKRDVATVLDTLYEEFPQDFENREDVVLPRNLAGMALHNIIDRPSRY